MNGNILVDMHIHTTSSDGTWDIAELIDELIKKNIELFSITDHDAIYNSIKIKKSVPKNIKFLLGSEISCTYRGREYHITAYEFNPEDRNLNELLKYNQAKRVDFNSRIIEYINRMGIINDVSDYKDYNYDRSRGGWESLNYLIDKGIVSGLKEYFGVLKSSEETLEFKTANEVIDIIKSAGGYAFLAHPSGYVNSGVLPLEILEEWREFGISGVECYTPYSRKEEDSLYYVEFCNDNNLLISAGSDCHGNFNNRVLGEPKVSLDMLKLDFI